MTTSRRPWHPADVPMFHLRLAARGCQMSDDDLDRLDGQPAGWRVRSRDGEYFGGFQLRVSGDATDARDARDRARTEVNAWLAANGVTATVEVVETYPGLRSRSTPPPPPDSG